MKGFRRLIIGLVVGLAGSMGVFGQKGIKMGMLVLPQRTWMLNRDDQAAPQDQFNYKSTHGMAAGLMVGYNFRDGVGFRLNPIYSAQGQKHTNLNQEDSLITHTRRLNYLKVPLFISFNTGTANSKLIFVADLGLQANFLLSARYYNDDKSYRPDDILFNPNVKDYPSPYKQYAHFGFGPVASAGVGIKLGENVMANISIRGDYQLSDAENKDARYSLYTAGTPEEVKFYGADRPATHNLAAGIMLGITYTFTEL